MKTRFCLKYFVSGCSGWLGRNVVSCLIMVVIFIRLVRAYRLGGDFKVMSVASHKEMGPFLWGELNPRDTM